MSVSKKVKALLSLKGMKQKELIDILGFSSRQSISNKFASDNWTAKELIKIAACTGSVLKFVLPDGQEIILNEDAMPEGDNSLQE